VDQPETDSTGRKFTYEFTVHQEGTFFYHAHSAMQEMMASSEFSLRIRRKSLRRVWTTTTASFAGVGGASIQQRAEQRVDGIQLADVQWVAAPLTTPLNRTIGQPVRLRFVNLGMDHHPIHLHGNQFVITGTEGGRAPETTWYPTNTVLVGVAQARVVEFEAKISGRLDDSLSPAASHDEFDDGLAARPANFDSRPDRGRRDEQMQSLAASAKFSHMHPSPVAKNAEGTRLSARCIHGNGNGRTGENRRRTGSQKLERWNDGNDDDGAGAAR